MLVTKELRPVQAHHLDRHAEHAVVIQVGRRERTGTRKANPGGMPAGAREETVRELGRQTGGHLEPGAQQPVRLGVACAQRHAALVGLAQEHRHLLP